MMSNLPENDLLPKHVAIIMDGNGRWAKQRNLPRSEGHRQGAKVFKRICEYAADKGIKYLTFYAFSTENWRRPPEEVRSIMDLFRDYLHEAEERKEPRNKKVAFLFHSISFSVTVTRATSLHHKPLPICP